MNESEKILDRKRGCLLGLAVGDAMGASVEGMKRNTFPRITGYLDHGAWGIPAGAWTDDTSMALALADSIATVGWDLNDQAHRYVDWYRNGKYSSVGECFDIGHVTRAALKNFERDGDARRSGMVRERDSGNGSIMRLAPVPIRYCEEDTEERFLERCEESSSVTHSSPACRSACMALGAILSRLIAGHDMETSLRGTLQTCARNLQWQVEVVLMGSYWRMHVDNVRGTGYVVDSLEAAIWSVYGARDFRDAILRAVNLGDDTDTTGAVSGQMAGARWGESGIPEEWLKGLYRRDMVEKALSRLGCGKAAEVKA